MYPTKYGLSTIKYIGIPQKRLIKKQDFNWLRKNKMLIPAVYQIISRQYTKGLQTNLEKNHF